MEHLTHGSSWCKWDLHIHTPSTVLANQYQGRDQEDKWVNFLDTLEKISDVSVLGVTDYFGIDGYSRLVKERKEGRIQNIELLLPNVEMRILPVTKDAHAINLHVIFDPSDRIIENLDTYFFQNLEFEYEGNKYRCTREDLIRLGRTFRREKSLEDEAAHRVGVEQFKVHYAEVKRVLRKNIHLDGHYIVGVSNNSGDGNSGIKHSSLAATRQEIYRMSDFIFSSNPKDRDYFLGQGTDSIEKVEANYGSLKPCFHGSDAHRIEDVCRPDSGRFTWIKADCSFEGLRQTIFEPDARVNIQQDNPINDYPKHYFSSISVKGHPFKDQALEFSETELRLNRDMITLIGGRGGGKSMLLDAIYRTFGGLSDGSVAGFQEFPFSIGLQKGSDEEEASFLLSEESQRYDYLHVRQGTVKNLVDKPNSLHAEVLRLLGPGIYEADPLFEEEVSKRNKQIQEELEYLGQTDDSDNAINSLEYQQRQIRENQALLETLATNETKKQVENFTRNTVRISSEEAVQVDIKRLDRDLRQFAQTTNETIDAINSRTKEINVKNIEEVDFRVQLEQIEALLKASGDELTSLSEQNQLIQANLAEKGFRGDIADLLSKADAYQRAIQQSQEEIERIDAANARLSKLRQSRNESGNRVRKDLLLEKDDISHRFATKQEGVALLSSDHKALLHSLLKDIDISGEIEFRLQDFIGGLWEFINGRKFRSTTTKTKENRLSETIGVSNAEDFLDLISGKAIVHLDDSSPPINLDQFTEAPDYFYDQKLTDFFDYLYLRKYREQYLRVIPRVNYLKKELGRLSVGQRGTFYLCLKLATESFSTPFVFDQPEDDLDNDFITRHLIPIFREIKKYRQVLIATHNANLVVNADSDQIIIASNTDENLSYKSGSLENPQIRAEICRILEGGEKAFLERERRYGIHHRMEDTDS